MLNNFSLFHSSKTTICPAIFLYPLSSSFSGVNRTYSTALNIPLKKKSLLFDYSPVYMAAGDILKGSLSSLEKQQALEKLLNESWINLYLSELNSSEHSKDYIKLLNTHITNFSNTLSNFLSNLNNSENIKHLQPLLNLPLNEISLIVFKILFPILFSGEEVDRTKLVIKIGKSIFKSWAKLQYSNINTNSHNVEDFSTFKDNLNFNDKEFLNIGDLVFGLILNTNDIFHINFDLSDPKNTKVIVSPENKIREMFERKLDLVGFKLPMVCPPVKWSDDNFGGYLSNKLEFDPLIKPSKKSRIKTKITKVNKDVIFNTVNYMSQVPYLINQDVLNFIVNNYEILGLSTSLHELTSKYYTTTRKNKLAIEIHNSAYYLQKNIIGLANLLTNAPQFYFPIEMDWRGRLYCQTNYITFQGNELAKSLIEFKNGKPLDNNGLYYFKIYGANVFGIDKESFNERVKWVDNNHQNILDMNIDFILKASEPFIFIAFCFEYRKYNNDPVNFISKLPIMLDASCNGLQHLSAMVGESTIAKNVNLLESDPNIKPKDFYQLCLDLIRSELNEKALTNPSYARIAKVELTRKIIKRSIMTIPYNVKKYGILLQLEESFEWVKIDNENLLKPSWYNDDQTPIYISKKELYLLSDIIHTTLFESHPLLKDLVKYLNDMAELLFKLSLPIVWITPSGLLIKQSYTKFKKIRVKPSMNKTNASYTILVPSNDMDLSKQKAAFMPNLVHSMDAANICIMVDYLIKENSYINLFTVHDCFASSANSIQTINTVVRLGFLRLYADNDYLIRLHNFYLNYIKEQNFNLTDYNTVITNSDEELSIPTPPKTNDLQLNDILNKAIYFIH